MNDENFGFSPTFPFSPLPDLFDLISVLKRRVYIYEYICDVASRFVVSSGGPPRAASHSHDPPQLPARMDGYGENVDFVGSCRRGS